MILTNRTRLFLIIAMSFGLSACSLKSAKNDSSLYIDLSSLQKERAALSLLDKTGEFLGLTVAPPTAAAGFACYAVNVTGPGIPSTGGDDDGKDVMVDFYKTLNIAGNFCSYRGAITPPLFLDSSGSATATLSVPPGAVRLVQIVGVNDNAVCVSGVVDDPPGSSGGNGGRFFEVGRTVLDRMYTDRSINVATNWPATAAGQSARKMDCGDAGCSIVDKVGAAGSSQTIGTYSMFGQRIAGTAGQYIRSVDLKVAGGAGTTATVTIYEANNGSSTPLTATSYTRSITFTATTSGMVNFDLGVSGSGYLQMIATKDYWIVLDGTGVAWAYSAGSGATGSAAKSGSTWVPQSTIDGFAYVLNQCGK